MRIGSYASKVTLTCDHCGREFDRYTSDINFRKKNGQTVFYCGKKCSTRHNARRDRIVRYRRVTLLDGTQIYEHRHIMEQTLGRPLLRHEQVHHKDGNKSNNDPNNLVLVTAKEHARQHARERLSYDLEKAIELYQQNKSFSEIANSVGAYRATDVWKTLLVHGIHKKGIKRIEVPKHWKFSLDEFKKLASQGKTRAEISSTLRISLDRAYDIAKIHKIPILHGKTRKFYIPKSQNR